MTTSPESQKLEQIINRVNPHAKLLRFWSLTGGLSAHMTALEVLMPDSETQKWVLRLPGDASFSRNPNAIVEEFKVLQALQAASLPMQRPIYLDSSGEIFPHPYLLMEYVEGSPDYAPANVTDFAAQVASYLAKVHTVPTANLSFLPQKSFAEKVVSRPVTVNLSPDEQRIRAALQSIGNPPPLNKPSLLHGDFWPGNLLWKDDQLAAVIDWEDAQLGDPLSDFAITRFDMCMYFGVEAVHAFTQRYQSLNRIDFTQLPYWDLYAALRAAPNLAIWTEDLPQLGRPDITEQTMREALEWFTAQALERLST